MSEYINDIRQRVREMHRVDISPPPRRLSALVWLSVLTPSVATLIFCFPCLFIASTYSYAVLCSKGVSPADYFPQADWQPSGEARVNAVGPVSRMKGDITFTYAYSGTNKAGESVAGNSFSEGRAPRWKQGDVVPLEYSEKYRRYRLIKTFVGSDGGASAHGWTFALILSCLITAALLLHFLRSFRVVWMVKNGEPAENFVANMTDIKLLFGEIGKMFTCHFIDTGGRPQRVRTWMLGDECTKNDPSLFQLLYDPRNPKRLFFVSRLPACDWPREMDGEVAIQSGDDVFYVYLRAAFAVLLLLGTLGVLGLLFQFWTI